jgi:hypothetical protein
MKAAAAARREKFKGLCKRLAGMSDAERAKLAETFGAVVNCEGRALSARNTFLVHLQCPGVSVVGGFRQWIKAGRCVMKGESALSILVPCARGDSGKATHEESGEGGARVFFIAGSVFDVSQTRELEGGDVEAAPVVPVAPASDLFQLEGGRES